METKTIKAFGAKALDKPLEKINIGRRALQPHDVEFDILYCGICHSDLHQIKNDFGHGAFNCIANALAR